MVLLAVLVVTGTVWAGGAQEEQASEGEMEGDQLKVALLLSGTISDQGWSYTAYQALKAVEEEFGAEVAYSEMIAPSDFEEVFRGYANAGNDFIIGHGFEFGDAAKKVAKDFPDTYFAITSSTVSQEPNLASIVMDDVESGFIQGLTMALLSETGKVGMLGGMEIPPIMNQQKGIRAGVNFQNPDVELIGATTGNFEDIAKAKEMALAMYEKDVDIIVPNVNKADFGVVEAAKETGNLVIGCTSDLGKEYPDVVITSLRESFDEAFIYVLNQILDGNFEAKNYKLGFAEGAIWLAPFRDFEEEISDENMARIEEVVAQLESNELNADDYLVE